MKKRLLFGLTMVAGLFAIESNAQVRFIDPVFPDVTKTANIMYDSNVSVNILYGQVPGIPPLYVHKLYCDLYQPTGDTMSKRPLVLIVGTGSFLPALANKQATGNKNDSSIVEVAMNLARRGYVVATLEYRIGWNPLTTSQEAATEMLLKATFRSLQDVRNAVRFFRSNASTYSVDDTRIALGGQGTGGYIAYAVGTVSTRADIESNAKFKRGDFTPMVNMDTLGDWTGIGGWAPLNLPGDGSVSSDLHMTFNWGGAMGDSAWMKPTSLPVVSLQNTKDALAPYYMGNVIVPVTGLTVIPNASGASHVIPKANAMGINAKINAVGYTDPISARARVVANGENNLYGFDGINQFDNAPWEFWSRPLIQSVTAVPYQGSPMAPPLFGHIPANGREADSISNLSNPTMTPERGKAYCDTIVRFVAPRMAVQFGITGPLTLNSFAVLSPATGTTVTVRDTDLVAVTLRWEKSHVPQAIPFSTTYTVQLDTVGNFMNPFYQIPLPGMDSVPVKENQLVGFAGSTIHWRIVASNRNYSMISSNSFNIKIEGATGLENADLSSFLKVFPNPAKEQVTVSMDLSKSPISTIAMIDVAGREISTLSNIHAHNYSVNTAGLQSGIYFLNVTTENGATATKRVVIQ